MEKEVDLNSIKEFSSFDESDFSYHKNIPHSVLGSWKDFHCLLTKDFLRESDILFRGQSNSKWGLVPALNRVHNKPEKNLIQDTLSRFRETLLEMGMPEYSGLEDNELWALGRHHGLDTPILDWTINPYVAVYFAVVAASHEVGSPTVFVIRKGMLEQHLKGIDFYQSNKGVNQRELAQLGLYSRTEEGDDLEDLIRDDKQNSPKYFRKVIFKDVKQHECRDFLNNLRVSAKYLYPNSIQGAAEHCRAYIPLKYIGGGCLVGIEQCVHNKGDAQDVD